jgi:hypothetical protein
MPANMERLMTDVTIRAPAVIEKAIQQEMFGMMSEFFRDSNCWREDIEFNTAADTTTYNLTPTVVSAINRLMWVIRTGTTITVRATMQVPGAVVIGYTPNSVESLTAQVALTVTDPVDTDNYPQLPDWILEKYHGDFVDGLLGRLYSQPAKPYSNERMAIYHMRRFRGAISRAKVEANRKNLYSAQAWAFPQNFATGR